MDDLLDLPLLRRLAGGEESLTRGERIFRAGRVDGLRAAPDRASARVRGSARFYRVKLWRSRGELLYNCSCPAGRDRLFCKHCVAVGLAWLQGAPPRDEADPENAPHLPPADLHPAHEHPAHARGDEDEGHPGYDDGPEAPAEPPPVSPEEVRAHVANLDKRRLVDLVMEALDYDEILRRRLMLETTGAPAGRRLDPERLEVYRRLLAEAIETGEYVDYDGMPDYVQGVEEALRPLHVLLGNGQPDAVIELAELAVVELDRAADLLDTADGSLNGVYDELQRLHLEACRSARPDPVPLAARLLDYELEGGLGIFNNAANAYAEVLGPRGLEAYRRRLTAEWNRLPPLRPATAKKRTPAADGDEDEDAPFLDHRRFQLAALMERAAAVAGADPDTLAAVRARDLSSPQDYLGIARLYEQAGRPEQAASWAEKGLAAFPRAGDANDGVAALRALLATLYTRLDRREDALSLAWAAFLNRPGPERLAALREATPADAWPKWRAHAHAHLRTGTGPAGRQLLVEALLTEDDAGAALLAAREAEAQSPGALRPDLWLALANRLEKAHPTEALEILRGQLDGLLATGGACPPSPRLLRQTGEILRTLRALFSRVGRPAEFTTLRAQLRATHHHHRGLVRLLDSLDRRR